MNLTTDHQYIIDHYATTKAKVIAEHLGKSESAVRKQAAFLRDNGLMNINKKQPAKPVDFDAMQTAVKKLQEHYAKVGEGQPFKNMLYKERQRLGYDTASRFCNAVKSYMRYIGVEGRYGEFVRGQLERRLTPRKLLAQHWNGTLTL